MAGGATIEVVPPLGTPIPPAPSRLAYTVLLMGGMFGGLMQSALTPVLAIAAEHFGGGGKGAITAQMIVTITGIGVMIGGPLAGTLTRWTGVRRMLLISLLVYAICGVSGLIIESAPLMFAMRFLQGMGSAGISITVSTLIAERFTGARRSQFLGFQSAFLAATGFIALTTSGQIAEMAGWRAPFALYAIALPVMVLVLLAGRSLDAEPVDPDTRPPLFASIAVMWRTYLLMILLFMAGYMIYVQLPFVLADENIRSPALVSQIIATGTAVHFFGGLAYGRCVRFTGRGWMLVLILLGMAISDILVYFAQSTAWVVVACGFAGLAGGNLVTWLIELLLDKAPAGGRPQALGLMYTALYIGDFLNPVFATPLRMAIGNREAFLLVGVLLLAASVASALLYVPRQRAVAS